MRLLLAVMVSLIATGAAAIAQNRYTQPWFSADRCTTQDAMDADSDLDRLMDWAAFHRTFKLYGQCDDGGLSEGYSDKVVILLTKQWPTVTALAKLVKADPIFGRFVLYHIDSLMSPEQNRTIIKNAASKCPADALAFCKRIEAEARKPPG